MTSTGIGMQKFGHLRLTQLFRFEYDERAKTGTMIPMGDIAPPKTKVGDQPTYHLTKEVPNESINICRLFALH